MGRVGASDILCTVLQERPGSFPRREDLSSFSTHPETKSWDLNPFGLGLPHPSDSQTGGNPEIAVDGLFINLIERQPDFFAFCFTDVFN